MHYQDIATESKAGLFLIMYRRQEGELSISKQKWWDAHSLSKVCKSVLQSQAQCNCLYWFQALIASRINITNQMSPADHSPRWRNISTGVVDSFMDKLLWPFSRLYTAKWPVEQKHPEMCSDCPYVHIQVQCMVCPKLFQRATFKILKLHCDCRTVQDRQN